MSLLPGIYVLDVVDMNVIADECNAYGYISSEALIRFRAYTTTLMPRLSDKELNRIHDKSHAWQEGDKRTIRARGAEAAELCVDHSAMMMRWMTGPR